MKEDGSCVRGIDFAYSIPKMIIDSIAHAKDNRRANLPVFIKRLIRSFYEGIQLIGDLEAVE